MSSIAHSADRVKAHNSTTGTSLVPARVSLEAQGSVFKVSVEGASRGSRSGGGRRGRVFGFSRASRKRMLEQLGRLELKPVQGCRHYATFITLTYAGAEADLPTVDQVKAHKRAFLERLRRAFPGVSAHWRFEWSSSGEREYHPHLHILAYGLPWLDKAVVNRWWREIVGDRWGSQYATRIEAMRSKRGAMAYLAKYAAKASSGLVSDAYPHAGLDRSTGVVVGDVNGQGFVHTGRVWGVHNRDGLPYADLLEVGILCARWFYNVKRGARKRWSGVNGLRWAGFTLFCTDPVRWIELALYYAGGDVCQ